MAAHFHIAFEPFAPPELGSAGRLWMEMADRDPQRAREFVRSLDPRERATLTEARRSERLDKRRQTPRSLIVPVPALLLATGHPVLRRAVFEDLNPAAAGEGALLIEDALRRRDGAALTHWETLPGIPDHLNKVLAGSAFPPEWLAALAAPCSPRGDSAVVIRRLINRGAVPKPMLRALAASGDTAGVQAVLDHADGRRCLLGNHKSVERHPAVTAFAHGHFELAHRLYRAMEEAATDQGSDNGWGAKVRNGWLACAESAFPACANPDDRGERLALTRTQWAPAATPLLRLTLTDAAANEQDGVRARLLGLHRSGFSGVWSPPSDALVGPTEWAALLMGPAVEGSLECLRAACSVYRSGEQENGPLVEDLRRARRHPLIERADWEPACIMVVEGHLDFEVLAAVSQPNDAAFDRERAALAAAHHHACLPPASPAARARM